MFRVNLAVLIVACCFAFSATVVSPAHGAEFTTLKIGIGGQGKPGKWMPVEASVSGLPASTKAELRIELPDPRADICIDTIASGESDASGNLKLSGYCRTGRLTGVGVASVVSDGTTHCHASFSFAERDEIVITDDEEEPAEVQSTLSLRKQDAISLLTIGDVEGIEEFVRNMAIYSSDRSILQNLNLPSPANLPDKAIGLDGVDLLLLADDFSLSSEQATSIKEWVRDGGNLFVSSGGTISQMSESPLGGWLTHHFGIEDETIEVRRFSTLEGYVPGASRIEAMRRTWPIASLTSAQSTVLVDSVDGPLIARQSVGAGVVTMLALDVNQLPLREWPSLPQFYEVLFFGKKLSRDDGAKRQTSRISQSGVSDLSTQLQVSVDAKPESGQWSTWSVMAILVLWLIAIGPVDYLIVNRLLKRPHLTWISFPLLIVVGALAIVGGVKPSSGVGVSEFRLVDITTDDNETFISGRAWASVSSADTMKTSLQAGYPKLTASDADDHPKPLDLSLGWSGRAEDIFGAMYRHGGVGLGRQTLSRHMESPDAMADVPLLANGSRAFKVTWHEKSDATLFTSRLTVSGFGLLNGSFEHHLPVPIRNWRLVHGNRVYKPTQEGKDVLPPNVELSSADEGVSALDLKGYLNASRLVDAEDSRDKNKYAVQVQTPYDATSTDRLYIVAMSNFYDVAGGAEYVGLTNSQLRNLEVSDTIRLNHAVLLGFIESEAPSLTVDGMENKSQGRETMVRLFIPVDRRPEDAMAPTEEDLQKQASTTNE